MTTSSKIATQEVISTPTLVAEDDRGVIEQLVKGDFQIVLRTTQKKGSIRANHYHQHDSHIGYVVSGTVEYMTRPVYAEASTGEPAVADISEQKTYIVGRGQLFTTPPMIAHATVALTDADIIYFTPRSGNQKEYENDLVRVELISPEDAKARAQQYHA
jgi:dTDP-4-dehydrorhamnose 3,5-epimerase-like enzyme